MSSFADVFIGVRQSKIAAIAVLCSIVVAGILVLFSKDEMPMGQKFVIVLLMFLLALPAIFFSLLQLTCLVTGEGNQKPWCGWYAWLITALIVLYSVMVVIVSIYSLVADKKVKETYANMVVKEEHEKIMQNAGSAKEKKEENQPMQPAELPVETFAVCGAPLGGAVAAADEEVPEGVAAGVSVKGAPVEAFTTCGAAF